MTASVAPEIANEAEAVSVVSTVVAAPPSVSAEAGASAETPPQPAIQSNEGPTPPAATDISVQVVSAASTSSDGAADASTQASSVESSPATLPPCSNSMATAVNETISPLPPMLKPAVAATPPATAMVLPVAPVPGAVVSSLKITPTAQAVPVSKPVVKASSSRTIIVPIATASPRTLKPTVPAVASAFALDAVASYRVAAVDQLFTSRVEQQKTDAAAQTAFQAQVTAKSQPCVRDKRRRDDDGPGSA